MKAKAMRYLALFFILISFTWIPGAIAQVSLDGHSVYYAADNQSLDIGDDPNESITVEAWILIHSLPNAPHFLDRKNAIIASKYSAYRLSLYAENQPWQIQTIQGLSFTVFKKDQNLLQSTGYIVITNIPINQWIHIAGIYDGQTHKLLLFINGKKYEMDSPVKHGISNSDSPLTIGGPDGDSNSVFFDGDINKLRISDKVRYNSDFVPLPGQFNPDANTRALYHFTEKSSPFADSSGNGNTLRSPLPVISDIPDQSINEGGTFAAIKLDDYVSSNNADADIKWTVKGNTKLTFVIDNNRVATITVLDPEWNGSETLTFTAEDQGGLKASDIVKFTVKPVNDPPVMADIPDQTIDEGKTFPAIKLDDFVSDPDNMDAEINWTVTGKIKLNVVIMNNHIAAIAILDPKWNGSETLTFTAEDPGGLKASDTVKFTVNTVNNLPVVTDIPNQTIDEGGTFTAIKLDDFVSDPDNTDAEIKWTVTGNTNITVTIGADRVAVIGVKDLEWNGNETVTFTAIDPGGLSASDTVKFTVTPVNDPPVVTNIPDQTINEGGGGTFSAIKLNDYVTDPDNTDAEMKWTVTGNTKLSVVISNDRVATITVSDPEWNGNETLSFTAEDPGGLKASDTAKFTVNAVNDPPVVTDIPDQKIIAGQAFTSIKLDDYVTDPDNADSEISWTVTGNSKIAVDINANRIATMTVADSKWRGIETVTFTAKDPSGLSASKTVIFTVKILLGDVNKDGSVKSNDAILILQIAAGIKEPSDYEKIAADVNEDGTVKSNDAIKILRILVGLGAPEINAPKEIQKPITLALSELHGTTGDIVVLPLTVDNNSSINGGDICIAYNSALLQAIDVSSASNALMVSKITDTGIVRIAFAGSGKLNGNTLVNIKFKVLSDGISPLRLKNAELYGFDGNPLNTIYTDKEFRSWAVAPEHSALLQNYPNPFNPETWIPYQLNEAGEVAIRIHNVAGDLVREIRLGYKSAGLYTTQDRSAYWNGKNEAGEKVASGLYFYTIQAGKYTATRKMLLLK